MTKKIKCITISEKADYTISQMKALRNYNFSADVDKFILQTYTLTPEELIELHQKKITELQGHIQTIVKKEETKEIQRQEALTPHRKQCLQSAKERLTTGKYDKHSVLNWYTRETGHLVDMKEFEFLMSVVSDDNV